MVHKDYGSGIPIQISVYDDRVLWNPGDLPENWTLAKLLGKHPSCPFDPLLANAFFRAGYIESWGRGIEKIQRDCREHGIEPPVYDFGMAGLLLTFRANPEHLQAEALEESVGTTPISTPIPTPIPAQQQLMALISANPKISQQDLAISVGLTREGIKYRLNKMKRAGVIRHVGPTRGGHWEVVK